MNIDNENWDFDSFKEKVNSELLYIADDKKIYDALSVKNKKLKIRERDAYLMGLAMPINDSFKRFPELAKQSYILIILSAKKIIINLLRVVLKFPSLNVELVDGSMDKLTEFIIQDIKFKNFVMYDSINSNPKSSIGISIIGVLFLFTCKDKPFTLERIKNFLAFLFRYMHIDINVLSEISEEQERILTQIRTSVKFVKSKKSSEELEVVVTSKKKKKDFSLTNIIEGFIKITYDSGQGGKHLNGHVSPVEHIRDGYWRRIPSGNKIWIEATIVNKGVK